MQKKTIYWICKEKTFFFDEIIFALIFFFFDFSSKSLDKKTEKRN